MATGSKWARPSRTERAFRLGAPESRIGRELRKEMGVRNGVKPMTARKARATYSSIEDAGAEVGTGERQISSATEYAGDGCFDGLPPVISPPRRCAADISGGSLVKIQLARPNWKACRRTAGVECSRGCSIRPTKRVTSAKWKPLMPSSERSGAAVPRRAKGECIVLLSPTAPIGGSFGHVWV